MDISVWRFWATLWNGRDATNHRNTKLDPRVRIRAGEVAIGGMNLRTGGFRPSAVDRPPAPHCPRRASSDSRNEFQKINASTGGFHASWSRAPNNLWKHFIAGSSRSPSEPQGQVAMATNQ